MVGIGGGSYPFSFFTVPYEAVLATTYWGSIPELTEVIALAERGLIRAEIERVGLDEAAAAYERLAAGEVSGRIVVVPTDHAQPPAGSSSPAMIRRISCWSTGAGRPHPGP